MNHHPVYIILNLHTQEKLECVVPAFSVNIIPPKNTTKTGLLPHRNTEKLSLTLQYTYAPHILHTHTTQAGVQHRLKETWLKTHAKHSQLLFINIYKYVFKILLHFISEEVFCWGKYY